jgi:hypothetical protein
MYQGLQRGASGRSPGPLSGGADEGPVSSQGAMSLWVVSCPWLHYGGSMDLSRRREVLKGARRIALPALCAGWVLWAALETKRLQGWFEFQDHLQNNSEPIFHFPTVSFLTSAALIIISLTLACNNRPRLAAALALVAALIIAVVWIGLTH